MLESPWRVALIDSGVAPGAGIAVAEARRFVDSGTGVSQVPAIDAPLGHGSRMARVIASAGVPLDFLNAQVFGDGLATTPAAVATAIGWSVGCGARLIHLSLGLREHRDVLATAVAAANAAGCILVASTPARGERSYPARYADVLSATGDARCTADEISWLQTPQAEFGACARVEAASNAGGASIGAAHLTRFIVRHCPAAADRRRVLTQLTDLATYRGPEQRRC